MKKEIMGLACFALYIFLVATPRNLRCPAGAGDSDDQPSRSQITSTLDFVNGNASVIKPCGPGSGGGRGPGSTVQLADLRQTA